jgi:hypothetical protein
VINAGLFLALYAGHVIGDFPLQFDRIFAWKVRSLAGVAAHAAICGAASLVFALPILSLEIVIAVAGVVLAHTAIDQVKVVAARRGVDGPWSFIADQVLHLATVAVPAFLIASGPLPFWLAHTYAILIAVVLAAYGGRLLTYVTERSIRDTEAVGARTERMEFLRRGIVAGLAALGGWAWLGLPVAVLLRGAERRWGGVLGSLCIGLWAYAWAVYLATGSGPL